MYVLRQVSYWGIPAHLQLDYCKFRTQSLEAEVVKSDANIPYDNNKLFNADDYEFVVCDNEEVNVKLRNKLD